MGVWHCSRKGCEGIMPDKYSEEYGYICGSCFPAICYMLGEVHLLLP